MHNKAVTVGMWRDVNCFGECNIIVCVCVCVCVKYITDCSECVHGVYCNIELLTVNCKNSAVYWVEHEVEGTTALRKAGNTASHTRQKFKQ